MASEIKYYTEKYLSKINGSTHSTMIGWCEGSGLKKAEIAKLITTIQNHLDYIKVK